MERLEKSIEGAETLDSLPCLCISCNVNLEI